VRERRLAIKMKTERAAVMVVWRMDGMEWNVMVKYGYPSVVILELDGVVVFSS